MAENEDFPIEELAQKMSEILTDTPPGVRYEIHFKWTCDACGERVTADQANVVYHSAEHTECPVTPGYVTDTRAKGGNYVIFQHNVGFEHYDGETQRSES